MRLRVAAWFVLLGLGVALGCSGFSLLRLDRPGATAALGADHAAEREPAPPPDSWGELLRSRELWEVAGLAAFLAANVWAGPIDRRRYHGRGPRSDR